MQNSWWGPKGFVPKLQYPKAAPEHETQWCRGKPTAITRTIHSNLEKRSGEVNEVFFAFFKIELWCVGECPVLAGTGGTQYVWKMGGNVVLVMSYVDV